MLKREFGPLWQSIEIPLLQRAVSFALLAVGYLGLWVSFIVVASIHGDPICAFRTAKTPPPKLLAAPSANFIAAPPRVAPGYFCVASV